MAVRRYPLPVTRVDVRANRIRREGGAVAARGSLSLDLADLRRSRAVLSGLSGAERVAVELLEESARLVLSEYEGLVPRRARALELEVELVRGGPWAAEAYVAGETIGLRLDVSLLEELGLPAEGERAVPGGLRVLYALALYYAAALTETRHEADLAVRLAKLCSSLSEEHREALRGLLSVPQLDWAGNFARFLEAVSELRGLPEEEAEERARWWGTWIISQVRRDYAYDVGAVREVLERHRENVYSAECRRELYSVIRGTYRESVEEENVARLAREARERGELVVFTRLGRASVVLGYLLAASRVIKVSGELRGAVRELQELVEGEGLEELYAPLLRLKSVVSRDEVPLAQVERAERAFFEALERLRASRERSIRERLKRGELSIEEAERELAELRELVGRLSSLMNRVLASAARSEWRHGAFVFFGQRISPGGAARIAYVNEGLIPYAGPSYGLDEYLVEGGYNVHATPSLAALKYVDYWIEALPLFIVERGEGRYEIDYENMEAAIRKMAPYWAMNIERALREGRRPTFIVVTTQSYNMTNLVRYWLEEEMALYNLIKAHGLEGEVERLVRAYADRIAECAERVIRELRLEHALEVEMGRGRDRRRALLSVMAKDPAVAREVAKLALVVEHKLEREVEAVAREMAEREPGLSEAEALSRAREEVLRRYAVDRETLRVRPVGESAEGSVPLIRLVDSYIRDHTDLAESTARREVAARHGLLAELPEHKYEAVGPRKAYNLVYAPSRVDLGPHEIESVVDLGQPLGAFDEEAAEAAVRLYELINRSLEGPYVLPNPASAEGQKTLENASRDDNYAFANLIALTAEAMGANAYSIISYINMRPTHLILWPGRGYGGFCIPKDGLFVSYVLGLRSEEVLQKLGVPEHLRPKVAELVDELLSLKSEYEDPLEWQEEVERRLGEYLRLFQEAGAYLGDAAHMCDVVERLCGRGDRWSEYLRRVARTLYEARYVPSRMVNNFMPYHVAALIYHALERAREGNPLVHPDSEAVVGIQASYKPGVQDSRLSTEFELFLALTKSDARLNRMRWRVLKELAHMALDEHDTPGEIRVIDPLISPDDWLFDSELRLKAGADAVREFLLERVEGLSEDDILANVMRFGADFESWVIGVDERGREIRVRDRPDILLDFARDCMRELGLSDDLIEERVRELGPDFREWPEFKDNPRLLRLLRNKIRGKAHWLVVYLRGFVRDFERGVRGLDVLSLGIPHPGLVRLVHDLPRLAFLMREGNPNSALAIVDGAAGARGPVLDKDMAKEWLALGGTYVAVGVSDEIVDEWRREMLEESERAEELLSALMDGDYSRAQEVLNEISRSVTDRLLEEYLWLAEGMELGLDSREHGAYRERYRLILRALDRVRGGLHVADLDFGTFLALGGRFCVLRRASRFSSYDEFRRYVLDLRRRFEERVRVAPLALPGAPPRRGLPPSEVVDEYVRTLLLRERPRAEEAEVVLGGALKGEMKEEWEVMQRRLIRIRQRRAILVERLAKELRPTDFEGAFEEAKRAIGEPRPAIPDEDYCRFLVWAVGAVAALTEELTGSAEERERFMEYAAESVLKRGGLGIHAHRELVDHLARLAALARGDKGKLEKVAKAAELVDIALAVELLSTAQTWREVWTAIARFFDRTLNCHIFDYAPYLYTRASFCKDEEFNDVFTRRELFELMARRHAWLYEYIRRNMVERTELKLWDRETVEKLLTIGTDGDDVAAREGYAEASRFVFRYARLRDLATLYHDGFFVPEVLDGVDPEAIRADERVNVVILYNLGNTTAMTFLRRGPHHHEGKGPDKNIILTNFLRLGRDPRSGREVALVEHGLMYLTKEEYVRAGGRNDILKLIVDPELKRRYAEIGPEGRLVFVRFKRPVLACVVFPHFTHPWFLNQVLERIGVPLNQTRVIDRLTYKKTEMPKMIEYYNERVPPEERIEFIDQVNIYRDEMRRLPPEERRRRVEEVLLEFSKRHPKIIIKTSTESGGRGTIIARIRDEEGNVINESIRGMDGSVEVYGFRDAVEFILREILPKDDAVVQEFIESRPREILTEEALRMVIKRFESVGVKVREDTPLYWSFRNYVTQVPGGEPQIVGWIMLVHVKGIANYGQGGQLFLLERDMFKPEYRHLVDEMERVSKATMKMLELYAPVFAKREGIWVGRDLLGNPYYVPMTNLSDLMLKPVYRDGRIVDWRVVPIEENIGMGLFYPYERELAKRGREGESVDPILVNLAIVGKAYKEALERLAHRRASQP